MRNLFDCLGHLLFDYHFACMARRCCFMSFCLTLHDTKKKLLQRLLAVEIVREGFEPGIIPFRDIVTKTTTQTTSSSSSQENEFSSSSSPESGHRMYETTYFVSFSVLTYKVVFEKIDILKAL